MHLLTDILVTGGSKTYIVQLIHPIIVNNDVIILFLPRPNKSMSHPKDIPFLPGNQFANVNVIRTLIRKMTFENRNLWDSLMGIRYSRNNI
jgi:hypothetical protein